MRRHFDSTIPSLALNLLRIITGFLLIPHGARKLLGMFGGVGGPALPRMRWAPAPSCSLSAWTFGPKRFGSTRLATAIASGEWW